MSLNEIVKARIQLAAILILAVFAFSLIFSQKASPNFPPLFALKRIQEKAYLNLKGNPQDKLDYMSILLNRRLEELDSIVTSKSYDYLLYSSLRYSTLAGQITEIIIENNMKDKVPATIDQFQNHKKVLQDIYVRYPKNTENLEYKYIEDDINYLNLYLDKLSK